MSLLYLFLPSCWSGRLCESEDESSNAEESKLDCMSRGASTDTHKQVPGNGSVPTVRTRRAVNHTCSSFHARVPRAYGCGGMFTAQSNTETHTHARENYSGNLLLSLRG